MKHLLPLFTLLLFAACDPCDCDDCCVDSTLIEFQNNTNNALTMVWHASRVVDSSSQFPLRLSWQDTVIVIPFTTVTLEEIIFPSVANALRGSPFEYNGIPSNYDSLQIFVGDIMVDRFLNTDCDRNPLCESAYNRSERELSNSTEMTFLYVYE